MWRSRPKSCSGGGEVGPAWPGLRAGRARRQGVSRLRGAEGGCPRPCGPVRGGSSLPLPAGGPRVSEPGRFGAEGVGCRLARLA